MKIYGSIESSTIWLNASLFSKIFFIQVICMFSANWNQILYVMAEHSRLIITSKFTWLMPLPVTTMIAEIIILMVPVYNVMHAVMKNISHTWVIISPGWKTTPPPHASLPIYHPNYSQRRPFGISKTIDWIPVEVLHGMNNKIDLFINWSVFSFACSIFS